VFFNAIAAPAPNQLRANHCLGVRLFGVCNMKKLYILDKGISLGQSEANLAKQGYETMILYPHTPDLSCLTGILQTLATAKQLEASKLLANDGSVTASDTSPIGSCPYGTDNTLSETSRAQYYKAKSSKANKTFGRFNNYIVLKVLLCVNVILPDNQRAL